LTFHAAEGTLIADRNKKETPMAGRLDQILVVDLESTCWEREPPSGQEHEIIEIGLCVLEVATTQRLENRSILVRPQRSRISDYCTSLTTLTQEEVDGGISLDEACRILETEYRARERLWASYGDYDRRQFERNCRASSVAYPFGPGHINVKSLFAVISNLSQEVSLDRAMKMLGFPLEGTHHRGADDAWNIARILGELLRRARGAQDAKTTVQRPWLNREHQGGE
jgi:inhibitor of KinA sporulation pathway (predicted exonuclease)